MKRTIICSMSTDFILGGIETYILRISEWCNENDFRFVLLKYNKTKISKECLNSTKNIAIENYGINIIGNIVVSKDFLDSLTDATIISTNFHNYLQMQRLAFQNRKKVNIIPLLYVLYPSFSSISRRNFLGWPINKTVKKNISEHFLFMDEDCLNYAEKYYGITLKKEYFRLGKKITPFEKGIVEERFRNPIKTVISISRMDFPCKGYQVGLIDSMKRIWEELPSTQLLIIGDGKDSKILEDKINSIEKTYQDKIIWIRNVPYSELYNYLKSSTLSVGMGTTLLDGAITGLPGIVAKHHTEEALSPGLFFEIPNDLGGSAINGSQYIPIENYIKDILHYNQDEYYQVSKASHEAVVQNYNIEIVMNKIINVQASPSAISGLAIIYDLLIMYLQKRGFCKNKDEAL